MFSKAVPGVPEWRMGITVPTVELNQTAVTLVRNLLVVFGWPWSWRSWPRCSWAGTSPAPVTGVTVAIERLSQGELREDPATNGSSPGPDVGPTR